MSFRGFRLRGFSENDGRILLSSAVQWGRVRIPVHTMKLLDLLSQRLLAMWPCIPICDVCFVDPPPPSRLGRDGLHQGWGCFYQAPTAHNR